MTLLRHHKIELEPMLASLIGPLPLVTDEDRRRELGQYINAVRPQIERAAFDVISDVVDAFNEVRDGLEARLEYRNGALFLVITAASDGAEPEVALEDGDWDRVTLRLPRQLKQTIDAEAGRRGESANSWYVRELQRVARHSLRDGATEATGTSQHGRRHRRRGRSRREAD